MIYANYTTIYSIISYLFNFVKGFFAWIFSFLCENQGMYEKQEKNTVKTMKKNYFNDKSIIVPLAAVASGFCNAVLGAGGGILLSLSMGTLLSDRFRDRRQLLITTQGAMIPGCIISCLIYASRGTLDTTSFSVFAIPALIGGAAGSLLLDKIKPGTINTLFSLLVVWSGCRMLLR